MDEHASVARTLLHEIESLGYSINSMPFLLQAEPRFRLTAWPAAMNPGGVYWGGEVYRVEAPTLYEAAVQLGQLVGIELEG